MWTVQIAVFLVTLTFLAVKLGGYMAAVFTGRKNPLSAVFEPFERFLYRLFGIDEKKEMTWKEYSVTLIVFNLIGVAAVFLIQVLQSLLPFNPAKLPGVRWDTAVNAAVSFATNTNWQSYTCEQTMSYFTQMFALAVQNFLSAATGLAAAVAFIRGFACQASASLGNFWVDLTRSIVYVLLPFSVVLSVVLISQGVVQNLNPYTHVKTLEGRDQMIAQGPAASQIAIKQLGTNGGGYFSSNSSHPYENPTPLSDWLEIMALLVIAAATPFTFGIMVNNRKQGRVIFCCMMILFVIGLCMITASEFHGNPLLLKAGIAGGVNMEGKEVRFGVLNSVFFAQSTTATSCGAVNCMHDSLMPLSGLVLLFNIGIGEVIFGGVGVGLIGILLYAILGMFLVGLMIGRTPELFGKKLEPFEMIMTVIAIVLPCVIQLVLSAYAVSCKDSLASINNAGPHGLTEILYAFSSAAGNNGSAFAGLNANTVFYNLTLAFAMLVGRFATILPAIAVAGSLAMKRMVPEKARFPTTGILFVIMLLGVVIIIGALTFFPVFTLGPVLEHLFIRSGKTF